MHKRTLSVAAAMAGAMMLAGCSGDQSKSQGVDAIRPAPTVSEPVEILARTQGDDDALARGTVRLIKDANALNELGLATLPDLGDIDFSSQDLVIFALGRQSTGGYWAQITGIQQVGEILYVQATVNRPGEDESVTQAVTHPYAAAVIAETDAVRALSDPVEVVGQPMPQSGR